MKSVSWRDFYGIEMKDRWSVAKKENKKVDLKKASKEISERWSKIKSGDDSEYSQKLSSSSSSSSSKSKKRKSGKHNSTKKKKGKKQDKKMDEEDEDEDELSSSSKKSHSGKGDKIIKEIRGLLSKLEKLV
tara:strand:- start:417 stop:809 length:393 start_codon:yes stop_codon:yes gene_type:complete